MAALILEHHLSKEEEGAAQDQLRQAYNLLAGCLGAEEPAALDTYLQRNKQIKVQEMMSIFNAISNKPSGDKEKMNYFVYAFYWAFTSCLSDTARQVTLNITVGYKCYYKLTQEAASKVKECLEAHKDSIFSSCTIQVPLEEEAISSCWSRTCSLGAWCQLRVPCHRRRHPGQSGVCRRVW